MDQPVHEIFVVMQISTKLNSAHGIVDDESQYHSCFLDKELARRACVILKHEDEISGLYFTRYEVVDDTMQYELPEQDPGMALTPDEIEEKLR